MTRGRYILGAGVALASAALAFVADLTLAQTGDTRTIQVTANVKPSCRFDSTPNINFGDLDAATASDKNQAVDVTFKCTKGVYYTLTVGNGLNPVAGKNRMKRSLGTEYIAYDISPRVRAGLGKGFQSTETIRLESTIKGVDYQNAAVGSYSDTVTLSIQP